MFQSQLPRGLMDAFIPRISPEISAMFDPMRAQRKQLASLLSPFDNHLANLAIPRPFSLPQINKDISK